MNERYVRRGPAFYRRPHAEKVSESSWRVGGETVKDTVLAFLCFAIWLGILFYVLPILFTAAQ